MDVVKVVVPAISFDTSFLPITKVLPKGMLPVLEKPALQYIAEEAMQSGVTNMLMVTGKDKQIVADFFDKCGTAQSLLVSERKQLLSGVDKILESMEFAYFRQQESLGAGHAVWLARHAIHKEYFGVMMPDDLILAKVPALAQLIKVARQEKASVIAVQEVPTSCVSNYGIIKIRKQITPNLFQLSGVVEKPRPKDAPSNIAIVGRYILSPKIFAALDDLIKFESEFGLTNAIDQMIRAGERVFAYKVQGALRFDLSTPLGWIKATIGMALQDARYSSQVRQFLKELDTPDSYLYQNAKAIEHLL
jgi:UTP--glucose-1-phosphate uridylyltransferase